MNRNGFFVVVVVVQFLLFSQLLLTLLFVISGYFLSVLAQELMRV